VTWLIRIALILLLLALVLRAIWRLFEGITQGAAPDGSRERTSRSAARMVKDPVCGTYVVPARALTATRDGETAWFCCPECQRSWQRREARASRG